MRMLTVLVGAAAAANEKSDEGAENTRYQKPDNGGQDQQIPTEAMLGRRIIVPVRPDGGKIAPRHSAWETGDQAPIHAQAVQAKQGARPPGAPPNIGNRKHKHEQSEEDACPLSQVVVS